VPDSFDKSLLMAGTGRKRVATPVECAEVRRLAGEGASVRAIAAEVFGDARFRGRVERILAAPTDASTCEAEVPPDGVAMAETVPAVRAALGRYLGRVQRGQIEPSVAEMVKLLDLERRLQAIESIELMNAFARAAEEPAPEA
jgi:hypothetical protein